MPEPLGEGLETWSGRAVVAPARRRVWFRGGSAGAPPHLNQRGEDVSATEKVALGLGTEGHGLSPRWEQTADRRAVIPMREGIDSLNVAAATAVAAYVTMKRAAVAG